MQAVRYVLERIRTSMLLVPILFVLGSVALAWLVRQFDQPALTDAVPLIFSVGPASARQILSTVAGATLTVAAIVFSVTLVTIQLAVTQYTPRLVQGFLSDRFQQSVVGIVAGTFVYCLLALSAVDRRGTEVAPRLSVTVAIMLGTLSVLGIISFIGRIGRRIEIDETMRGVAKETTRSVERHLGAHFEPHQLTARSLPEGDPVTIRAPMTGWIHEVDVDEMLERMPENAILRLEQRLGDRVVEGEILAKAWGMDERAASKTVVNAIEVAQSRNVHDDPSFGLRQLVDIALRALSPGVNDPTTAADVVRHLVEPLTAMLGAPTEGRVVAGEEGQRIYLPGAFTRTEFVQKGFEEIRISGIEQPYVIEALVEALDAIHHRLHGSDIHDRCEPLIAEAQALRADLASAELPRDSKHRLMELIDRSDLIRRHLEPNG